MKEGPGYGERRDIRRKEESENTKEGKRDCGHFLGEFYDPVTILRALGVTRDS